MESDGILCSGWVFFLQTSFDFLTSHFRRNFLLHSKGIDDLSLYLKRCFTYYRFFLSNGVLKIAILVNLGKLTRDTFRPINTQAELA